MRECEATRKLSIVSPLQQWSSPRLRRRNQRPSCNRMVPEQRSSREQSSGPQCSRKHLVYGVDSGVCFRTSRNHSRSAFLRLERCKAVIQLPSRPETTSHSPTPFKPTEMEQTTSRLRKTFRYPTDNDADDDLPEALDEEGSSPPPPFSAFPLTICRARESHPHPRRTKHEAEPLVFTYSPRSASASPHTLPLHPLHTPHNPPLPHQHHQSPLDSIPALLPPTRGNWPFISRPSSLLPSE